MNFGFVIEKILRLIVFKCVRYTYTAYFGLYNLER